ncbi:MAG: NAD(P)H-hydrate epimerase [Peptoniphilaceae bacterium]|nr:NAD(P)H-hydrate epimerase [Peptoniphilaceae bacterium]MDY6085763.1 NAD(P)H-hydrate epimerase [Peptoniphilaceae bacterium]
MRSVTREEMERIISYTHRTLEIPEPILVENAAIGLLQHIDLSKRHSFAVFCGPGNNGADGLALARQLLIRGKRVGIYLVGEKQEPSEAWLMNRRAVGHLTDDIHRVETLGDLEDMLDDLHRYNTVVDALFGTGLNRELKGIFPIVIDNINQSRIFTLSVDMPSGLDATTGQPYGAFIEAGKIVTLGLMKTGLEHNRLIDCPVKVSEIGLPLQAIRRVLG